MAEEKESLRDKLKRINKNTPKTVKLILIIVIAVFAFIIIITAAWKQELLKITSGKSNEIKIDSYLIA